MIYCCVDAQLAFSYGCITRQGNFDTPFRHGFMPMANPLTTEVTKSIGCCVKAPEACKDASFSCGTTSALIPDAKCTANCQPEDFYGEKEGGDNKEYATESQPTNCCEAIKPKIILCAEWIGNCSANAKRLTGVKTVYSEEKDPKTSKYTGKILKTETPYGVDMSHARHLPSSQQKLAMDAVSPYICCDTRVSPEKSCYYSVERIAQLELKKLYDAQQDADKVEKKLGSATRPSGSSAAATVVALLALIIPGTLF